MFHWLPQASASSHQFQQRAGMATNTSDRLLVVKKGHQHKLNDRWGRMGAFLCTWQVSWQARGRASQRCSWTSLRFLCGGGNGMCIMLGSVRNAACRALEPMRLSRCRGMGAGIGMRHAGGWVRAWMGFMSPCMLKNESCCKVAERSQWQANYFGIKVRHALHNQTSVKSYLITI